MPDRVRNRLKQKASHPDFKKKSAQCSKNKREGSSGTNATPGHCQGSVSSRALAERVAKSNGGRMPIPVELYLKTHQRKGPDGQATFCDDKSKEFMAHLENLKDKYKNEGSKKSLDEIYFEAAGGFKKGNVYGLGSCAPLFYERTIGSSSRVDDGAYAPSIVAQLEDRLQQQSKMIDDLVQEKLANKALFEEMRKDYELLSRFVYDRCGSLSSSTQTPRDPPSSGGSAPCAV